MPGPNKSIIWLILVHLQCVDIHTSGGGVVLGDPNGGKLEVLYESEMAGGAGSHVSGDGGRD